MHYEISSSRTRRASTERGGRVAVLVRSSDGGLAFGLLPVVSTYSPMRVGGRGGGGTRCARTESVTITNQCGDIPVVARPAAGGRPDAGAFRSPPIIIGAGQHCAGLEVFAFFAMEIALAMAAFNIPNIGGSRDSPPRYLVLSCNKRNHSCFVDVFGRLDWVDVASIIARGCGIPSKVRCIHPDEYRAIIPREDDLSRTIPADHEFDPSEGRGQKAMMIENAYPPETIERHSGPLAVSIQKER